MSTTSHPPRTPFKSSSSSHPPSAPTTSFLQQRDALVGEIAVAMEHVLQSINKLNRSIEGVIAVGNEFGAVEALWSQFENVMAKESAEPEVKEADAEEEQGKGDQQGEEDEGEEGENGRDEDELGKRK